MNFEPNEAAVRLVIITGMSGAGRRTAAHVMEDLGWFVVDNLPPAMLPQLVGLALDSKNTRVVVGIDVRNADTFDKLPGVLADLAQREVYPEICYLEADDDAIVRRQESLRRPLPLQGDGTLLEAIAKERRLLSELRAAADLVIDTSKLTNNQLAVRIRNVFGDAQAPQPSILITSFGFKNGVPPDADLVLDVRFLPNPHWVPQLRPQTGLASQVAEYVVETDAAQAFLTAIVGVFDIMWPGYLREGKRSAQIAIGCTGGKHRSVAIAEALAVRLRSKDVACSVMHRDLGRE